MLIGEAGKYGTTIGGVQVFTVEGAVEAFKRFSARCYADLTMESSVALSDVADAMHRLGFSWVEIEEMELASISQ